jgi:hypothetical protein
MVCFAALERNFVSPFQDASHRLFDLAPVKLANLSAIFITDLLLKVCLFFTNMFSEQFFFRIFRVALLFICQGSQLCKLLFACPRL